MQKVLRVVRNTLIHILVLLAVFVVAVVVFERLINQAVPTLSGTMDQASFPLVYMQEDGVSYNCLHGYAHEMDVNDIRDTVTILGDDHLLEVQIQPFDTNIESISYEVVTLDGANSLENTNVLRTTEENGYVCATLELQNQMLLNQEYILKLNVTAGGREIYFYTRILLEDGLHLDAYLDFVSGFYEKCINKTDQESLGAVVEPDDSTGESQTLASMDIHDSVSQLMWGALNPQIYYKPTPSLVDINGTTASFVLDYRISATDSDGITVLYNVKEFYRLRYTDTRVYLLDFTRTTDEVFNAERSVLQSDGINLGITGTDIEYAFDEERKIVAFVQENVLWQYEINSGSMTRVFGFPQQEDMDYRDFYDQNNISILRIEDNGDMWFLVSGYMNRGDHEGENGIALYYFNEASSTTSERLFIRTMEAHDSLELDLGALAYITEDTQYCYILLEGIVYRIDVSTGEYERVIEEVKNDCYTSSESNRYFSWLKEGERYNSQTLCTIDLETGEIREQTCQEQERLRPICYIGEDLVYGTALVSDIDSTSEGNEVFPMYRLDIVNSEGASVKEYVPEGMYIMDTEQSDRTLRLYRAVKSGDSFEETTGDQIVSTDAGTDVTYGITTQVDDVRQTEILLRVGTTITDDTPQVIHGRMSEAGASRTISIAVNENREKLYYVYAGGRMESRWPTAVEAILRADEKVGVVINDEKEYIWERGNRRTSCNISLDKIPDIVKSGTMDVDELEAALQKDVVDLTGCTLEEVLYFVSEGRPVIAATPTGTLVITGYDDYGNLIVLYPGSEETEYSGPNDSLELFEAAGNRFVSYLDTDLES